MAIHHGNIGYTPSGRKRKTLPKPKTYKAKFEPLVQVESYRRDVPEYKSASDMSGSCSAPDRSYTKDATFTVAPAYNKGAYQVISKDNLKDIGR